MFGYPFIFLDEIIQKLQVVAENHELLLKSLSNNDMEHVCIDNRLFGHTYLCHCAWNGGNANHLNYGLCSKWPTPQNWSEKMWSPSSSTDGLEFPAPVELGSLSPTSDSWFGNAINEWTNSQVGPLTVGYLKVLKDANLLNISTKQCIVHVFGNKQLIRCKNI